MKNEAVDLLIIGGGPIGMACGIEAQKHGLSYIIIEKGCLVNSIYNYPRNMTFFSTSDRLEIGEVPFISHLSKPTRSEALEYYRRVTASWKLNVRLYEAVETIAPADSGWEIATSKGHYQAENLVLSTGFYDLPYLLNVPGEDLPKVRHYYDEPHPYYGQRIVVVGAGNSAVDVALETFRKGAEVTMVIRNDKIKESVKYWVKPDVENRIKEGTIKAYFQAKVAAIDEESVTIQTPQGKETIPNDFVLAMTGYQPNFALLESLGVTLSDDGLKTPTYDLETQESNIESVYLAGVVCGGLVTNKWFIENSRVHAVSIVKHILSKSP